MQETQNSQIKWLGAALLVAVLAAFLVWRLFAGDEQPAETAAVEPPAAPATVEPEPAPMAQVDPAELQAPTTSADVTEPPSAPVKPTLPSLDASDDPVRKDVTEASEQAAPLLSDEFLIRKAVRAVSALAGGNLVNQYRPLKDPASPFAALQEGETFTIDPKNYDRYSSYINALNQMGAERVTALYWHYYPLLEEAYQELGVDKREFREVTVAALDQMLALKEPTGEPRLTRPTVMYKFADPNLEALPAAQKLMLRIGPENREKLRPLLEEIRQHLQEQSAD